VAAPRKVQSRCLFSNGPMRGAGLGALRAVGERIEKDGRGPSQCARDKGLSGVGGRETPPVRQVTGRRASGKVIALALKPRFAGSRRLERDLRNRRARPPAVRPPARRWPTGGDSPRPRRTRLPRQLTQPTEPNDNASRPHSRRSASSIASPAIRTGPATPSRSVPLLRSGRDLDATSSDRHGVDASHDARRGAAGLKRVNEALTTWLP